MQKKLLIFIVGFSFVQAIWGAAYSGWPRSSRISSKSNAEIIISNKTGEDLMMPQLLMIEPIRLMNFASMDVNQEVDRSQINSNQAIITDSNIKIAGRIPDVGKVFFVWKIGGQEPKKVKVVVDIVPGQNYLELVVNAEKKSSADPDYFLKRRFLCLQKRARQAFDEKANQQLATLPQGVQDIAKAAPIEINE